MYDELVFFFFFFSSRRRHTRWTGDWSSDVCSSDLGTFRHVQLRVLVGAAAERDDGWMLEQDDRVGDRPLRHGTGQGALEIPGLEIRGLAQLKDVAAGRHGLRLAWGAWPSSSSKASPTASRSTLLRGGSAWTSARSRSSRSAAHRRSGGQPLSTRATASSGSATRARSAGSD